MRRFVLIAVAVVVVVCVTLVAAQNAALLNPKSPEMNQKAPEKFRALFSTSKGDFTIEVTRAWAPNGADRFYNLVKNGFFDDCRFFRVVSGFMVQFGINGDPKAAAAWMNANIPDDKGKQSNTRGMVTFATRGANTRTTQLFINFGNNAMLDPQGFTPFGKVIENGMDVVDKIYSGYGEQPDQGNIQASGNVYLNKSFPRLDYIKTAKIVE